MIGRLESAAGRAIEGWTARLFHTRLEPVQLAKRCIRAMETHRTIALERTFVPNSYAVALGPSDHARFASFRTSLERDLAGSILGAARDRGYTLVAFPEVALEADPALRPGEVRVSCALVDAGGAPVERIEALADLARGHTAVLDREALLTARAARPLARLEAPGGTRAIGEESLVIGRDPRCDLVLDDPRVSRRHAEIRPRLGRFALLDLGSTNGTRVNGTRVTEAALADGDRIEIARAAFVFRAGG